MKYKKKPGVDVLNTEPEKENRGLKNFAATDVQEIGTMKMILYALPAAAGYT